MTLRFNPDEIARLATQVPRYTSYPTAPHFSAEIGNLTYREWLRAMPSGTRLSLYLHIPFCDTLCWFCGCHTRMIRRYTPVSGYLDRLIQEIQTIGALLPDGVRVTHIHWGGGSPTLLAPRDIVRLNAALLGAFQVDRACDFAVEIDPRGMDDARLDALAEAGLTRASIGVQDFDPKVQAAINRFQSFEETRAVVEALRLRGVGSLNIDLLYGLPHQETAKMLASLDAVLTMRPDRIALFGYAHVPWMKKHQELIPAEALPGMAERAESAERAAERLVIAGYHRIGIDHFALPRDPLAVAAETGTLRRNFQGYTTDDSDSLIGLGASAIGQLPQGFIQNIPGGQAYERSIGSHGLAVARGFAIGPEDRLRRDAIESLMCRLSLDLAALRARHGELAARLEPEIEALFASEDAAFVERMPSGFRVNEAGRPFLRLIAARFDAYLPRGSARHSTAL
ncbi:MAG: oxygen-independent coproporphyrinogen III oxidase [Hyphomicrobiales bacterium]|uniref:oxygen-independent coproporphyrinogen III oxidase n=1 Tax=Rhabdaerophilum calidifontis TaxID=2604328 RepID=UPI001239A7F7|nr:oxygen-independent coproporphyrinogen III oxidase [Rhabdaerophilum calidifontis]MCA1952712.1 oxygen-independent coproporphyrinogen III oxidase [Hyphomicrobiales bacterium]MCA1999164.1 oxygen-independent coproporphyrinogen III oxidase [Hyphomicrobiales bacterium]